MGRGPRSHCPISLALEAIGDRWSLLILRDVIVRGKTRYQEFLNSEEGISTNILADRLVRLEQQSLLTKSDDPDDKRQFRYSPTQKALDLLPIIFEMGRWSAKYDPGTDVTNPFFLRMKAGKEGFLRQIRVQFEGLDGPGAARQGRPLRRRRPRSMQG
ncbi:MAG TPA: helix-turn-helix domain-containing protein [bacterium]|nr:helix-turn-helix domain-containing protein [bacterium]